MRLFCAVAYLYLILYSRYNSALKTEIIFSLEKFQTAKSFLHSYDRCSDIRKKMKTEGTLSNLSKYRPQNTVSGCNLDHSVVTW